MSATHCKWFLTQKWQISMYCKSTHVWLCVWLLCLSSPRRGVRTERASDRRNRRTDRQIEWSCTWCFWGPFPCFDLLHFLFSEPGFTEPLPAMPSNSPAAAEPPQTPQNDTANDVVREMDYSFLFFCFANSWMNLFWSNVSLLLLIIQLQLYKWLLEVSSQLPPQETHG